MKKINIAKASIYLFPSIFMLLITILSFMNFREFNVDWKGIFLISLFILFPIVFLLQGIFIAKNKMNIFLSSLI